MPPLQDTTNTAIKLKNLTTLVRHLLSDLKEGCTESDNLFRKELNVNYIEKAYVIYEEKVCSSIFISCFILYKILSLSFIINSMKVQHLSQLTALIREVVENASSGLKEVIFSEDMSADNESELIKDSLITGTNLFELYLALQSFAA